jgi:hypothetical protein
MGGPAKTERSPQPEARRLVPEARFTYVEIFGLTPDARRLKPDACSLTPNLIKLKSMARSPAPNHHLKKL